jgi:hypothetical protein
MAQALGGRRFGANGNGTMKGHAIEAIAAIDLSKRERAICGLLARSFGKWIATERLIAHLYESDPNGGPDDAEGTVRVLVHHTRKKLLAGGLAIESHPGSGYRLAWADGAPADATPTPAGSAGRPSAASGGGIRVLRAGDVDLGVAEGGAPLGIALARLIEGRLLIQGVSGAGKSWTLRRLLEQTAGLIQQIVIDPEGEFHSLAGLLELVHVKAHLLDEAAIDTLAARVRAHRISVLFDVSDSSLTREAQMIAVAAFLSRLVDTHVRKLAIGATVDLMSRGRKRGLTGVLATLRLARMSKSVISDVHNFLIGINTLDLDLKRAAATIGWHKRTAEERLKLLAPGDFVAIGPGFTTSQTVVRIGPVESKHIGAAPALARPPDLDPERAGKLLELDALIEAAAADRATRDEAGLVPGLRAIRGFIRDPSFALAGQAFGALIPLAPDGTTIDGLAKHLKVARQELIAALALLDQYGALEMSNGPKHQAVRLAKGMLP